MISQYHHCVLCGKQFYSQKQAFLCKYCQDQEKYTKASNSSKNYNNQHKCPMCTFQNIQNSVQCSICHFVFEQKLQNLDFFIPQNIQKETSLVICKKCKFQNHLSNGYCLNCQQQLFQHIKKPCEICGLSVKQDNYTQHYEACLLSKSLIQQEQQKALYRIPDKEEPIIRFEQIKAPYNAIKPIIVPFQKPKPYPKPFQKPVKKPGFVQLGIEWLGGGKKQTIISCYYCYKKIQKKQFNYHLQGCQKKQQWSRNMSLSHSRMTPLQVKAIMHMHQKSEKQHQNVRVSLETKIQKLGYSNQDLDNLQFYIQNYAPIIIQIHISKHMQFFLKDTHYRSQFETNKSSGSLSRTSRTQWEDRMFDNFYSKATDFQRVKYGVINFTNDPKGVQCAKTYGPSYFLLKSHVRDRCTFTDKDSSSADASIATLKFGFKIISKMNDKQLKAAFQASKALENSSNVLVTYKQLQIHGPIQFSKDIERIYVNKEQINGKKDLLDMVYEFSHKYKVDHDFI